MVSLASRVAGKIASVYAKRYHQEPRDCFDKVSKNSLLSFYSNNYSQRGQDGILNEIFRRLNIKTGFFVEFGGWDGVYLSNCRSLFEKGWSGVFIEGDSIKASQCQKNYQSPDVQIINSMVGAPNYGCPGKNLSSLLTDSSISPDLVTFVSIDVDGFDLEIFLDMGFRPLVVLLEGGFAFSPLLSPSVHIATEYSSKNIQQPFPYICEQVAKSGYSVVSFLQDAYLVRTDLAGEFEKYSPLQLFSDAWFYLKPSERHAVMSMREKKSIIVKTETEHLGRFCQDPLGY